MLPKVDKPLIKRLDDENIQRLLPACEVVSIHASMPYGMGRCIG